MLLPVFSLAQVVPISFLKSTDSTPLNQVTANALHFDGVDDYVSIPTNAIVPQGASSYTIEAYIKPSVHSSNGIVGWGNYGSDNRVNALRLGDGNNIINYWWGRDLYAPLGVSLADNKWYHIAATYDGSKRKIYLDGVLKAEDSPSSPNVASAANFRIGSTNNGEYFKGSIDDVRIWNVARTQAQIQANMNTELLGNEVGLKAYYTFNQGIAGGNNATITTISDKTSNALNGTLMNFAKTGTTSNFVQGKVPSNSALLIPKGNYAAITTSGTFPFNTSLGSGNVSFTGFNTYQGSTTWGPQALFDNVRTNFDWCSNGGTGQFGQFVFPRAVTITKIFLVPRNQGDSFPNTVTLKVDGNTLGTYTRLASISSADGLNISYTGTGHYIQPNITGTTWRLEFPDGDNYIGELEFWGY